jgi:hypothetical protein
MQPYYDVIIRRWWGVSGGPPCRKQAIGGVTTDATFNPGPFLCSPVSFLTSGMWAALLYPSCHDVLVPLKPWAQTNIPLLNCFSEALGHGDQKAWQVRTEQQLIWNFSRVMSFWATVLESASLWQSSVTFLAVRFLTKKFSLPQCQPHGHLISSYITLLTFTK